MTNERIYLEPNHLMGQLVCLDIRKRDYAHERFFHCKTNPQLFVETNEDALDALPRGAWLKSL
jgi:hypothetical protein